MGKHALILFAHGARAASWAAPFERLRELTQARLPDTDVSLAFLELMEPLLQQQVAALVAAGVDEVTVVPVFLGQGGHVLRDLPLMLDQLRASYPALRIHVVGAVGEDPDVLRAMTDYCVGALGAAGVAPGAGGV
ncbi:sirohydrochlorin chelatase [Pseudoduganella violacea]|uniref:Sirohydrochlorin cobaltochelatase n=1 Tax=Pseudoduganella violacea TaxID=1715466 RepID=A0A7W5BGG6_9BURK|nr:CbiX/SirB N-terminal domain-containing protein [Pseudoduganella violacea]MBB3122380.1 sirohydrochlorin cobaltochelatase [Pseudoduganella violacea]